MRVSFFHKIILSVVGLLLLICFQSKSFAEETASIAGSTIYGEVKYDPELDKLFKQAMDKRESGNLAGAVADFQQILTRQPKAHRARLEMAVAYYKMARFQDAIKEAEAVLDDPQLPPNVRVSILAFLSQVKADSQAAQVRNYWRFPVHFGYVYDNNVNAGPSSYVIDKLRFESKKYARQSDSGVDLEAGIDHTYQTGFRFATIGGEANLLWQSGLFGYYRAYFKEQDHNFSVLTLRTGPTLVVMGSWRANINFQYDYLRYDEDDLAHYYYIVPSLTLNITDSLEVTTELELNPRDFIKSIDERRDSFFILGRVSAWYTAPKGNFAIHGGVEVFDENAEGEEYSNHGVGIIAGGSWRIITNTDLFGSAERRFYNFEDPPPGFDEARDEDEWRLTAGIAYTFENMGFLSKWKAEAKVVYTDLDSNLDLYSYDRTETLFILSKTF